VRIALITVILLVTPPPGWAQTSRVEVEIGGGLLGGAGLGTGDANLRANATARQPFRLFTADSRFERAPTVHVRAAVPLTSRFALEGGVTRSRPDIRTSLTADAEGAAPLTSIEQVDQYVFDASLVWMVDALRLGDRLVPLVTGGGGYLRQLHEGRTVIEHGQIYHAGGGVKYWLFTRTSGFVRSTGLRGDVRVELVRGGISFEERPRPHAAISGGVFVGF
jgi:hypothetical protein